MATMLVQPKSRWPGDSQGVCITPTEAAPVVIEACGRSSTYLETGGEFSARLVQPKPPAPVIQAGVQKTPFLCRLDRCKALPGVRNPVSRSNRACQEHSSGCCMGRADSSNGSTAPKTIQLGRCHQTGGPLYNPSQPPHWKTNP
jgi:hypothetical protein